MNTIVNGGICLSNDLIRSLSAVTRLASFVAELSPHAIKTLEDSRNGWQDARSHDFPRLLLMTKLVAIGVILEGPELVHGLFNIVKRARNRPTREHPPNWIAFVGLVGWILVAIGVAGEFWVDGRVNSDDDNIQSINITLLQDAGASATQARSDANNAYNLAQGASKEADSFETKIVSATNQATDAESQLADALQRAANAEAEMEQLRLSIPPRRLSQEQKKSLKRLLAGEPKENIAIRSLVEDHETLDFATDIGLSLTDAGYTVSTGVLSVAWERPPDGDPVGILFRVVPGGKLSPAAIRFQRALLAIGIPSGVVEAPHSNVADIDIIVGHKAIPPIKSTPSTKR